MPKTHVELNRRWRWKHPAARRLQRNRYYEKGAQYQHNAKIHWSDAEERRIVAPRRPCDRILAQQLGRTVRAIQVRRVRVKNEKRRILMSIGIFLLM